MISIPLEVGDIILTGRFKNKRVLVREIGVDDYGNPTVNGRSILKIRIPKLYKMQEMKNLKEDKQNEINTQNAVNLIFDWVKSNKLNRFRSIGVLGDELKNMGVLRGFTLEQTPDSGNGYVISVKDSVGGVIVYIVTGIKSAKKYDITKKTGTTDFYVCANYENNMKSINEMALKVKIKKDKDKYNIYACTVDGVEENPLNYVPYETLQHATASAIYKGYDVDDELEKPKKVTPIKNQEVPRVKHDKPKEMDLGKEREIKLENLVRRIYNEMDYSRPEPKADKLKKGSVITVEGWIMLKGLDEGSYYVVSSVDDSTYTFKKSNKNGKPNNSFGKQVTFYKTTIDRNIDTTNNHRIIIVKDGGISESLISESIITEQYTENDLKFVNGKASIKKNGKVIAQIYYRPEFYKINNITSGYSYPYALNMLGGIRECKDINEVLLYLNKYSSKTESLISESIITEQYTENDLKFVNGKASIKKNGKVIALVFHRPIYYKKQKVANNTTKDYAVKSTKGFKECSDINEVLEYLNSNYKLKESTISELDITDPTLVAELETMADLAERMDKMKAELSALTAQFQPLDEKFTAMIDAIDENKERVLRTKNVLVTIKKKGYEAKSPKYKEIFELLYGKVNGKLKKIADELLAANTTIKKISSSIATQKLNSESKLNEGMLSNLWNKVKNYITSFTSKIKQQGQSIDADLEKLEKLSLR